ncbi:RND family efflux transporter, MFP subunit [Chthonomonas calidirosea]|uniref:RND family efflux transporter, MFP subunit n=1 Tax=Chthonomonas calidirosea (strain DSM 23976 / ICMP 18418 / T49) TaxID=1303518 RepID=S0EYX3_CHTCT|nr:efflux RND transporter periplasmic adaptor subunit [Chthonomonas calidirosea]CCW35276.1 RND family efflux transporter, MFP subunit [Chthonomonas calidirosea T49]CEK19772.1 RND family efflux transporter, MFP subunit [Chthonomonas calidirosea]CEK20707.1 RND family efflux transporter, MFP subunit [Chthonomonas calidirosea]
MKKRYVHLLVPWLFLTGCNLLGLGEKGGQVHYRVAAVTQDMVRKTVSATGVLTPWTTVDIKSRAGGRIISLPVDDGTVVKKGQVVALIDPSDTLLTYYSAKADIDANRARVVESQKDLQLQLKEGQIGIDTAKANLKAAQAQAAAAQANYQSAQTDADNAKALSDANIASARATLAAQQAKLDQMKNATIPQERAQAQADLQQAKANLINAEAQLTRQKALLAKGFVAQSEVDQAQAARDVAAATVLQAQAKVDTLDKELDQDLKAQEAQVAQAKAALDTALAQASQVQTKQLAALAAKANAQQALATVKQAQVKLQDAQAQLINNIIRAKQIEEAKAAVIKSNAAYADAKVQLNDTRITAPMDGVILQKYVEQGTFITSGMSFNSSGTSIVQLGDISRMYVDTSVDETDVANIQMGQKVEVTFDAYPSIPFDGKVIRIEPQEVVNQNVTTLHVRVEVDNSNVAYRLLRPGMNATCEFIVDEKDDVTCIPNEALQTANDGSYYVLVATGGHQAPPDPGGSPDPSVLEGCHIERRPVQIGLQGDDTTEITEGLKVGEKVVTQTIQPINSATASTSGGFGGGGPGPGRR